MTLVKVKGKYQVTIPTKVRNALKLDEGDFLEMTVEGNRIVLVPQEMVERVDVKAAVQEGLDDYKAGHVTPPFETMEAFETYRQTEAYRKLIESD